MILMCCKLLSVRLFVCVFVCLSLRLCHSVVVNVQIQCISRNNNKNNSDYYNFFLIVFFHVLKRSMLCMMTL